MISQNSFDKKNIKILLLEGVHPVSVQILKDAGYTNVERLTSALNEADLIEKIKDVRVVGLRSKTQITAKVLENAPKLMAVGCFCIGTNQVDLAKATEKGVAVFNSPYSNTRSVAELVIAEIVMLMRGIPEKNHAAHNGRWLKSAADSYEVRGKTLGIIGYGHIGSQVSVLAESMGLKVIYYDVVPKLPLGNALAINTLEELLASSDIVTLHVPEAEDTINLMSAERLSQMKKSAKLINLSRGTVVDIAALKTNLESGHISGAALDVYPLEPKSKTDRFETPLAQLHNVLLTPHIGGSTQEAQRNIGIDAAYKIINYLDKGITIGSHTVPELNLPTQRTDTHRLLHIHNNVAGIMAKINTIFAEAGINISGQYLNTNEKIGYVVLDVDSKKSISDKALDKLTNIQNTIRKRVLY